MKRIHPFLLLPLLIACTAKNVTTGTKITGDFDGDGTAETAEVVQTRSDNNPNEEKRSNGFLITFSNGVKQRKISCFCSEILLVNEGDLNHNGGDEISVVSYDNDITGMQTYSIINNHMISVTGSAMLGDGKTVPREKLQDCLFEENGTVFQYCYPDGVSVNEEGTVKDKPVKKEVIIK